MLTYNTTGELIAVCKDRIINLNGQPLTSHNITIMAQTVMDTLTVLEILNEKVDQLVHAEVLDRPRPGLGIRGDDDGAGA